MTSAAMAVTARSSVATRPQGGEVPLREAVLLRRRVGHVEVVTFDQAVPHAGGRQLSVDLVADAALAGAGSAADEQRLASFGHGRLRAVG
jgi:hypothetical protein